MTSKITTTGSAETQALAAQIARKLQGGEVIELSGDLGSGKTTFVQGLAHALSYTGEVASPTFTLCRIYALPSGLSVYHYDLYRLGQAGIIGSDLLEHAGQPGIITIIEWAGIIAEALPADRLIITFEHQGEDARLLTFHATGPASAHLIKGLQP